MARSGRAAAFAAAAVVLLGLASVAAATTVTLQTGRLLPPVSGGTPVLYNATRDTAISTQYIDPWNNMNGITYLWGSTAPDFTFPLGDVNAYNPADKFRTLMRFDEAHSYVPADAVVQSAELTVTFINYNFDPVLIQGCFMTRPWAYQGGPSYKTVGWAFSDFDGSASVPWTQPGAWGDCSPNVNISFVLPSNGAYGYVSQTIALDPASVQAWLPNNGSANYGLLFRAVNGSVSIITSQWQKDTPALRRPALSIAFSTSPADAPPPAVYPVTLGTVSRIWWVDPSGNDTLNSGHSDSPFRTPAKAIFEAWPGDRIFLNTGVYPGALNIERSRITLQSAPGQWAVVSSPTNDPQQAVNVITLRPGADHGVIQDLEVTGGFSYGISFLSGATGPSHWTISNVRIHHTGSSNVKLSVKAINNTFSNCDL